MLAVGRQRRIELREGLECVDQRLDQQRQQRKLAPKFIGQPLALLMQGIDGGFVMVSHMGNLRPVAPQKCPGVHLIARQVDGFGRPELAEIHLWHGRQVGWPDRCLQRVLRGHQSNSPITVPTS
ncbi:hypothetical protein D3C76_880690 [compost metagenome]